MSSDGDRSSLLYVLRTVRTVRSRTDIQNRELMLVISQIFSNLVFHAIDIFFGFLFFIFGFLDRLGQIHLLVLPAG